MTIGMVTGFCLAHRHIRFLFLLFFLTLCLGFPFIDIPDSNGVSLDEGIVFFNNIFTPHLTVTVVKSMFLN